MKKLVVAFMALSLISTSCKKKEDEGSNDKVGGCTDSDSPLYKSGMDFDDGSCKYAKVTEIEVRNFPEEDGSQKWDAGAIGNARKADIYLKVKPVAEASYTNYFTSEGNEIDNAVHNDIHPWTSAVQFKLTNADWYYELMDADGALAGADDVIATGTFNPISLIDTDNNWVNINHTNGTHIRLKVRIE